MSHLVRDARAYVLLLAATLTVLSNAMISPALPSIEADFADVPNADLLARLLLTAPSLVVALLAPLAGGAADRFGRIRQMLLGTLLFALAGTAGLWLEDLTSILASRLLLGVAVAMVMTAQSALIGDFYSGPVRARFMGYQMSAVNFSGFLFITLAGFLATLSWRAPFAIYGLAFLFVPLFWALLPKREIVPEKDAAPQAGEGLPGWQLMVGAISVLSGLTFVLFYVLPTQVPYYLAELGDPSPVSAGRVMASMMLCAGISAMVYGPARDALGRAGTPAAGMTVMALGFWLLHDAQSLRYLMLAAAVVGTGLGLVIPCFINIALGAAPPHRRGMASGVVTTSIFLGQFLSPVVSLPVIARFGYADAFAAASLLLLAMAASMLVLLRERPRALAREGG
ncbi:MFS transporter [Oceanicola granulosus]|uniref:MFS transporter n=1 Tax=Oceanicola granulosus TaxID=252302 RepID=UPI00058EBCFC|nr:MFS transporter [Oceanicola granulosus]